MITCRTNGCVGYAGDDVFCAKCHEEFYQLRKRITELESLLQEHWTARNEAEQRAAEYKAELAELRRE